MKIFPQNYIIETKNYQLRIPHAADIPAVFSATRVEGFNEGMQWDPPEKEEELFQALARNIKAWEEGRSYVFSILKKGESDLLGRIGIRKTEDVGVWDVGFWTHPSVQGQGIMTEALAAILNFGFVELSASRIEACHALWNTASEKVLKKNGLKFVRYIEKGFQKRGKWIEENKLAISREEWELGVHI